MYVYAVVAVDEREDDLESFATCVVSPVSLWRDSLVDTDPRAGERDSSGWPRWPLAEKWFPSNFEADGRSKDLHAAVLLGTSGGSWVDAAGDPWACKRQDLSEAGEELVAGLEKLYGLPVELLTFIDT